MHIKWTEKIKHIYLCHWESLKLPWPAQQTTGSSWGHIWACWWTVWPAQTRQPWKGLGQGCQLPTQLKEEGIKSYNLNPCQDEFIFRIIKCICIFYHFLTLKCHMRYCLIQWISKLPLMGSKKKLFTHWYRVMHKCVGKLTNIGSNDNGLSPGQRQAFIWSNVGKLLIGPLGTNLSKILIRI